MKLKLGPLPDVSTVKLTVTMPAVLKIELEKYAEIHARTYGTSVDVATLIPIMLTHFLAADKLFQRTIRRPTEH